MVDDVKISSESQTFSENVVNTEVTKATSLKKKKKKVKKSKKIKNDQEIENNVASQPCSKTDIDAEDIKISLPTKKKSKSKKVKKTKKDKVTTENENNVASHPCSKTDIDAEDIKVSSTTKKKTKSEKVKKTKKDKVIKKNESSENDPSAEVTKVTSPTKNKTKAEKSQAQKRKKLYQAQEATPENINISGNKHVDYRTMEQEDFENAVKKMKFNHKRKDMEQFGNYQAYYGYRNTVKFQDVRMDYLKKEWFAGKKVLDIGCNGGQLTLLVARDFQAEEVLGCDIDERLIKAATININNYSVKPSGPHALAPGEESKFPENISFKTHNYVPGCEKEDVKEEYYDVIMLMSVSKWIHLNWGDEGLKQTFTKIYKELKKGGKFIFEPQPWRSYGKVKKNCEKFFRNFYSMELKPEGFSKYLSEEVGFDLPKVLRTSEVGKGFCRDILMFTKPE